MLRPKDVYDAIEKHHLGHRLYLSSTYECTERWTNESLEYKVLLDFMVGGGIEVKDIHERLRKLADEEFEKQYANPADVPIFVYLTALKELGEEPYTEKGHADYREGCEIVMHVGNLHWARRFQTWVLRQIEWEKTEPTD